MFEKFTKEELELVRNWIKEHPTEAYFYRQSCFNEEMLYDEILDGLKQE